MIVEKKSLMTYNEKRLNHHFRKTHMEQLNLITNFLGIKDKNIIITNEYDMGMHKNFTVTWITSLLNVLPARDRWANTTLKASKSRIWSAGYRTLIRLKSAVSECKECGKMAVLETSLVKKNHQIATVVYQRKSLNCSLKNSL